MTSSVIAIGSVVIFAAILAVVAKIAKQPVIPMYILAGIIVGPMALKYVMEPHAIESLSEMTIIFVMFAIGLEMDIDRIKTVGSVVTIGGLLQVLLTGLVGFLISLIWFNVLTSVYIGLMFTFASTALVVKLMADKRQLDTLQGGIVLGILLLQDIVAIIALSLLPAKEVSVQNLFALGLKSFGLVFVGILAGQHVFPRLLRKVSDSAEILTLASVGIGFAFAFLAESQGLSASIGAFITGVSLANLPYGLELQGRMKSIRDFFLPIFFASLGVQIVIPDARVILPIVVMTVACLTLKPLLISTITALFGYQKKTAFYVGISLVPISEFGLVIVALGIRLGHINQEIMTISIAVMALSMLFSAYLFGDGVYKRLSPKLRFMDRIGPDAKIEDELERDGVKFDAILLGLHRAGRYIYPTLCDLGFTTKVVESSFERVKTLVKKDIPCILGDATEEEVWEKLGGLEEVKLVVSTIPDFQHSQLILLYLKEKWPHLRIVMSAEHISEAYTLLQAGADWVMCGSVMAGQSMRDGALKFLKLESIDDAINDAREELLAHLKLMMGEWDVHPCDKACPVVKSGGNGEKNAIVAAR